MSIHEVSARLTQHGIKHLVVSADNQIEAIVKAVRDLQKDCLKAKGPTNDFQERAQEIRKLAYAVPEAQYKQEAPQELLDLSKALLSISQAVFPKPTPAQLTDRWKKKFYNHMSIARAVSRNEAQKIAQAKTMEDVLEAITFCMNTIARRDAEATEIASDLE